MAYYIELYGENPDTGESGVFEGTATFATYAKAEERLNEILSEESYIGDKEIKAGSVKKK